MNLIFKVISLIICPICFLTLVNLILLCNPSYNIIKLSIVIFILTLIGSIGIAFFLLRKTIKQIKEIIIGIKNISSGKIKQISFEQTSKEVDELTIAFNQMAKKLIEEKEEIKEKFEKYISEDVAEIIIKDTKTFLLKPTKKIVTILFADIRGFTTFAEKKEPEEVIIILNKYLSVMTKTILEYKGTLNKFIGDNIMAIFDEQFEDEKAAIKTAIAIQKEINKLNKEAIEKNEIPLEIGISINTGEVIMGNIGSELKTEHTVIGDTVNIASRLVSISKGGQILIDKNTYNKVKDEIEVIIWQPTKLKGRTEPIEVYQVMGMLDQILETGGKRRHLRSKELLNIKYKKIGEKEFKNSIGNISGGGILMWTNEYITGEIEAEFSLNTLVKHVVLEIIDTQQLVYPKKQYTFQIRGNFKDISIEDRNDIINFVYSTFEKNKEKEAEQQQIKLQFPLD